MKKYKELNLFILFIMFSLSAISQKRTYDVLSYTLPKGWKEEIKENGIQLYNGDSQTGEYAVAVLLKSSSTQASAKENFNTIWDQLVKGTVTVTGDPVMTDPSNDKGWEIISGYANFTDGKNKGMATLLSATGGGKMTNTVLMTNTQKYQEELLLLLNSIELTEAKANAEATVTQNNRAPSSIVGLWVDYILETSGYFNGVPQYTAGYFRKEYVFNADGTYVFRQKNWSTLMKEILFVYESGRYRVNNNQLTLTPDKGEGSWWSKSASGRTTEWGSLVKKSQWKLETTTYTFELHYYSGTDNTSLILKSNASTERDGGSQANPVTYNSRRSRESLIDNPPGFKPGLGKPTAAATQTANDQPLSAIASPLTGKIWEGTSNEKFTNGTLNGYNTGGYFTYQYLFNADNTYRFVYVGASAYTTPNILQYETGTYSVKGSQLTIVPGNGTNEEWSVKGGPVKLSAMSDVQISKIKSSWDRRISSISRKLQTYTYNFRIEYMQGNKANALIMEHTTATEREGKGNTDYYFETPKEKSATLPASFKETAIQMTKPSEVPTAGKQNARYEVWESQATNISTLKPELKTVILSSDKKCLYYMPEKGLNGVSPENSNETGSWGAVTDKGNMLTLANPRYGNMELYRMNATSMSRYADGKGAVYKKCKPVDGLRFEGAYSPQTEYYSGKESIISKQIDPDKRPVIFFKKDGTYINEGIEFSNLTFGDPYALGKGTYELVNYSLILTTASGKKLQVAFTPVLDGGTEVNDGFIINNQLFYRLGKQFQPHQ